MPATGMMSRLAGLLGRFAVFWAVWWLLTDGRADGLAFGAGFAAVAALMPLVLADAHDGAPDGSANGARPRALLPTVLRGLLLLPFFLWQSLYGGVDVALRALRPRMPLAPTIFDYRLRLPPGPAPVMLASLVSLMPGTLATVSGARLRVHVLDAARDYQDELELLEGQVAWVFGVALKTPRAPAQNLWRHGPEQDA